MSVRPRPRHDETVREGATDVTLKSLLVYLDPAANGRAVLEVACDLGRRHGAHLAGLPAPGDGSNEPAASAEAKALEEALRDHAVRSQLSHEVVRARDDDQAGLVLESRAHDLLIIGQARPGGRRLWPQPHHLLESAILKSGHPLIAVPHRGSFASVGGRVLVAWNGAREAARAVEDALPILEKAGRVTVLTVDLRSGDALSVDHLAALLERHEVAVDVQGARSQGRPLGAVLLDEAGRLRCDLLVMGGYGHSPLREHLFGGATHHVIEHMDLPVLLSH